jgi:hypothetical protein
MKHQQSALVLLVLGWRGYDRLKFLYKTQRRSPSENGFLREPSELTDNLHAEHLRIWRGNTYVVIEQ